MHQLHSVFETIHAQSFACPNEEINVDRLISKYAIFPNEAVYLIDFQQLALEPLTKNFSDITGIDCPHKNDISLLYEHIHPSVFSATMRYTDAIIKCAFDKGLQFAVEADFQYSLYKTHHNRTILKTTALLSHDLIGTMQYSIGKLIDVTNLIPFQHFNYKFVGPNRQKLYERYRILAGEDQMLSKREKEVLGLIGQGFTSRKIAEQLYISKHTVDQHRRNIIGKLEVSHAREAFIKAKNLAIL